MVKPLHSTLCLKATQINKSTILIAVQYVECIILAAIMFVKCTVSHIHLHICQAVERTGYQKAWHRSRMQRFWPPAAPERRLLALDNLHQHKYLLSNLSLKVYIHKREKKFHTKKLVGCWVMWCEADAAIARWETFWSSFGINTFLSIRRRCTELSVALQSGVEELAGCYPHLTFYCAR